MRSEKTIPEFMHLLLQATRHQILYWRTSNSGALTDMPLPLPLQAELRPNPPQLRLIGTSRVRKVCHCFCGLHVTNIIWESGVGICFCISVFIYAIFSDHSFLPKNISLSFDKSISFHSIPFYFISFHHFLPIWINSWKFEGGKATWWDAKPWNF